MVEGAKLLAEAVAAGHRPETVFVDWTVATASHEELAERCQQTGADVVEVAPGVLARVADAVTPQPIAAIMPMLHVPLAEALATGGPAPGEDRASEDRVGEDRVGEDRAGEDRAGQGPVGQGPVVVCAGLQDPGNAGTVIRSAAAAGAQAVVLPLGAVDLYNPKVVRATAGAVFHVPLVADADGSDVLDQLGRAGWRRLAATPRQGDQYDHLDLVGPTALVLGSESHGLSDSLAARVDGSVHISMEPGSESINVAMAATILLFEAARQRRIARTGDR